MISLFVFLFFLIAAVVVLVMRRKDLFTLKGDGYNKEKVINFKVIIPSIVLLIAGFLISIIQPFTYERVDAGNLGVQVNLTGSERGISDIKKRTGWVMYNTWTTELYQYPIYQQHVEYEKQEVILKGGFPAHITPTFNYSIKPDKLTEMFAELRLTVAELEQGWLKTAIINSVNDVSNRWKVEDIFENREKFEIAIVEDCNKRVGDWFDISQLRTNIKPPKSLQKAIEEKTQAKQQAEAKQQQVQVAIANGKKMIAEAQADSAKRVIDASGIAEARLIEARAEAEAIKIKQREVSTLYNDYIRAQKWDGQYPTTVAGGNAGLLLDIRK